MPSLSVLALVQILSELSPFQRERGAAQMLQPGYVKSLLDIFQVRSILQDITIPPVPHLRTAETGVGNLSDAKLR